MAQTFNSSMGLALENKRLLDSLQRSNRLLSEANEKLIKAVQAKYESMAEMSHEMRTSLNIIIGFAELMLDEVPGNINEEQRQSLTDILNSGRRLLELIQNNLERPGVGSGRV
jgi:signal transduction histidine kinase